MYKVNYEVKKEVFNDDRLFEDVIFQKEVDGEFVFNEKKLNLYSKALRLENGKEYQSIYEWVMDIMGKNIIVCIKPNQDDPTKKYASYFKPEDDEIKDGEKLMNIENVEVKDYVRDGIDRQFIKIFLREVEEEVVFEQELPF